MGFRRVLATSVTTIFNWLIVTFLPDSSLAEEGFQVGPPVKHPKAGFYIPQSCTYDWSSITTEDAIDDIGKRAINERESEVLYKIARLYFDGHGTAVLPNLSKAIEYFTKAADFGEVRAMYNLGLIYTLRVTTRDPTQTIEMDLERAIKFFEEAAHHGGHVDAMYELGYLYTYGVKGSVEGSPTMLLSKDIKKAVGYFEQAEECGQVEAMYELGRIYEDGGRNGESPNEVLIVEPDLKKALYYYRLAVHEGGHAEAMSRLSALVA